MNYKVGDKVRIREDLTAFKTYNGVCAGEGMLKYGGEIATITARFPDGSYVLDIDSDYWSWTPEMFDQNYKPESENYMKTSEFKNELEKMGYTFDDERVKNEQNLTVAWINTSRVNLINCNYACVLSSKLFNLIFKYATTPIAEREDDKLFNVQIIKGKWGRASWLYRYDDGISTSYSADNNDANQQWTLEQIKEYEIDDESVYKRVPAEDE